MLKIGDKLKLNDQTLIITHTVEEKPMTKPIKKSENKKPRIVVLETAAELTGTRRSSVYGEPIENFSCVAELKNIYKSYAGSRYSAAHDAAIDEVLVKLARIATGKPHIDNYIDGAAYFAIAHECQELS